MPSSPRRGYWRAAGRRSPKAAAQARPAASAGEVKDDTGRRAARRDGDRDVSPAQIGTLTAVTNEAGIYRFPSVPPGEYKLEFELAGFRHARPRRHPRHARLQRRRSTSSSASRRCRKPSRSPAQSPVIDTSATRVQTNYDQQALASLPNARDMWSLLGVDAVGHAEPRRRRRQHRGHADDLLRLRLLGPEPAADRRASTRPKAPSAAGFYLDYGSFEEVFIGAAGNSAEMPNPGVLTQFVEQERRQPARP